MVWWSLQGSRKAPTGSTSTSWTRDAFGSHDLGMSSWGWFKGKPKGKPKHFGGIPRKDTHFSLDQSESAGSNLLVFPRWVAIFSHGPKGDYPSFPAPLGKGETDADPPKVGTCLVFLLGVSTAPRQLTCGVFPRGQEDSSIGVPFRLVWSKMEGTGLDDGFYSIFQGHLFSKRTSMDSINNSAGRSGPQRPCLAVSVCPRKAGLRVYGRARRNYLPCEARIEPCPWPSFDHRSSSTSLVSCCLKCENEPWEGHWKAT